MVKVARFRILLVCGIFALAACNEPGITGVAATDSATRNIGNESALPTDGPPRLLRCPSFLSSTTTSIIGPLGGLLELRGSSITLPPGAVIVPTVMRLTVPASRYMEVDITANNLPSFLFRTPVTVTIDYSRCWYRRTDRRTLTVWHIDPDTKALLQNMGGTDDKLRHRITFTTDHLSAYAIAH